MNRPNLTHAGIFVRDLARMTDFYTSVLALMESDRGRGSSMPVDLVFLTADPEKHHQLVLAAGRPVDAPSTINQISFQVDNLDSLRSLSQRANQYGAERLRSINHGNAWSVYFNDPEGNTVEVYIDTPWYVSQPHGDALDLGLPDAEIFRSTEAMCRADPGFMPVTGWQEKMRKMLTPMGGTNP